MNHLQSAADSRVTHWWEFYLKCYPGVNLGPKPQITINPRLRVTAGLAFAYFQTLTSKIELSQSIMAANLEYFDSTIAHEVSHIIADFLHNDRCIHDWRWQAVFAKSGFVVERCHNYTEGVIKNNRNRTQITCPHCTTQISISPNIATKIRNGQERLCSKCRGRLNFANVFRLTKAIS